MKSSRTKTTLSTSSQLPGLKAAFGGYSRPTKTDLRNFPRPQHDFAYNRSFELRLKNSEILMAQERYKQEQNQLQLPKQRSWVTRRADKSDLPYGLKNVSKLAECNRIAVYNSCPAPTASPPNMYADCSNNTVMNTSGLSETGDSGIFTSSYHSDHGNMDHSMRMLGSQSFDKSFPDIHEDSKVLDTNMDNQNDFLNEKMREAFKNNSNNFSMCWFTP